MWARALAPGPDLGVIALIAGPPSRAYAGPADLASLRGPTVVFGMTDRRNSIRGEQGSGTTTDLLERESELGGFAERIEAASSGRGATVAIEGEAGIGKTALLAAAVELARMERIEVLAARGGELERDLPYGVVRQLFEPALARTTASRRELLLAGAAGLALPAISPVDPRPQRATLPAPCCTAFTGWRRTWPRSARCCWCSTTPTGWTRRRFASSPISRAGPRSCPC